MQFEFLPDFVIEQIRKLPKNLAEASAREIEASHEFDPPVRKLRMAFWAEYELSASRMKKMSLNAVAHRMGMTSRHVEIALRDLWNLAFIMCPPESYENFIDEALDFSLRRLRDDVLTLPVYTPDPVTGEKILNTKVAELILKTVAFLDVRKHGMPKQRIEQITMQGKPSDFLAPQKTMKSLEDVEKRIAELEASGITIDAAKKILEQGGKLPTSTDSEIKTPTSNELKSDEIEAKRAVIVPEIVKNDIKSVEIARLVGQVSDVKLDL